MFSYLLAAVPYSIRYSYIHYCIRDIFIQLILAAMPPVSELELLHRLLILILAAVPLVC